MIKGLDYLGLAHKRFPWRTALRMHPKGVAIGVLDDFFHPKPRRLRRIVKTFCESGKVPAVRIHLGWRNHDLTLKREVEARAPKWERLAQKFPEIKFYLSHSLEHREQRKVRVQNRMNALCKAAPHCIPVNCIWQGFTRPSWITEKHPNNEFGAIASTDGYDFLDLNAGDYFREHKECSLVFAWDHTFNGRERGKPPLPVRDRTNWPSEEKLREIIARL